MIVTAKYMLPEERLTSDPAFALGSPTILITVEHKSETFGTAIICSDDPEHAMKEALPHYIKEFISKILEDSK